MKNKFEDFCYVCGEVVPEEQGLAERLSRTPGEAGWGETKWGVRHKTCATPPPESTIPKQTPSSVGDDDINQHKYSGGQI
jgi:hypothetical protein